MTRVLWTLQAVEDVEAIRDFIARDSPHYAALTAERIVDSVERLKEFPRPDSPDRSGVSVRAGDGILSLKPGGYSGTPLARKLGVSEGRHVLIRRAPVGYARLLEPLPPGVVFERRISRRTDIVHLFTDRRARLKTDLEALRKSIRSDGAIWVSWPKKSSKIPTDITEDTIRELALPLGFVDVKVCGVSEVWSGLKLVIRKENRK